MTGSRWRSSALREPSLGHFLDTEVDPLGNLNDFKTKLVEAVGIERPADHVVSPDSVAIALNVVDGETRLNAGKPGLADQLGTRVPNKRGSDAWFIQLRHAWGTLRVV